MPISFEYRVMRRTTRATSGHEVEELQDILDEHSVDGWRLCKIINQANQQQIIIFERGR
jgi:hypothetical protein